MEISFKEAFTFMFKDEKFKSKYIIGTLFCVILILSLGFYLSKSADLFSYMMSDMYNQILGATQTSDFSETEFISFYAALMGSYLLMFLGSFVMLFSIGYVIEYAKQKISTDSNELPEWKSNYGKMFLNGLKMYGGMLLFSFAFGIALEIISIVLFFIIAIVTAVFVGVFSASESAVAVILIIMAVIAIILFLLLLFGFMMFSQMAFSSFLVDTNPLSFFNFKRMGALAKNNVSNMFVITLFMFLFGIVFSLVFLASIIFSFTNVCTILLLIFQFYILLVVYNLLAQYTQIGMKKYLTRMEAQRQAKQQG